MLIIHGANDHVVPVRIAITFHERLEVFGVSRQLIVLPEVGHAFDMFHPKLRRQCGETALTFFNRYLAPSKESAVSNLRGTRRCLKDLC